MSIRTVAVAGNINADLSYSVARLPKPGETLIARDLVLGPGGKAANQSVAISRLGGRARLIGCVGEDPLGRMVLERLRAEGVDTEAVVQRPQVTTGVASVCVFAGKENAIVTGLGANMTLKEDELSDLDGCNGLLVTLGIPELTIVSLIALARARKIPVIVDATPLRNHELNREFTQVDILSANRVEAEQLLGNVGGAATPKALCEGLLHMGAHRAVLKLGAEGAVWHDGESLGSVRAPKVEVIDPTGAGDAFMAALALRFLAGVQMQECVRWACAAGALAATRRGAQAGVPGVAEMEQLAKSVNDGASSG